jgi:V/A-type H+-transporting ATPase subunit I
MLHLTLLCMAKEGERTLERLRLLGCVHLDLSNAASPAFAAAKGALSDAERAVRILETAEKDVRAAGLEPAAETRFDSLKGDALMSAVLDADAERAAALAEADGLRRTAQEYAPFGDFDPAIASALEKDGLKTTLAKAPASAPPPSAPGGFAKALSDDGRTSYYVVVAPAGAALDLPPGGVVVPLPQESLGATRRRLAEAEDRAAAILAELAAANARAGAISSRYPELKDRVAFAAAEEALSAQGEIAYIEGWMPADSLPAVRAAAVSHGWGLASREPHADEAPPTLIRPPKLFRPVVALFEGLGISPAYNEADVSVPFMCYFSVFFAMLVGDGGYGALMFAAALWGWRKTRPVEGHRPRIVRSWLTLMTVFSFATVVWGILSNSWFGVALPWCRDWATVKWLGDPTYHNMMFLCFTIGVSHLMVARIWNGVCKHNSLDCLEEFGWAGILFFMYFVVNAIVGVFETVPSWSFWVFGVSLAMVVSRTRGVALGMLPLNVMGAMGDIISYVRLFAVGYASLQLAQNFNSMATQFDLPIYLKMIPMVLILLVGHAVNLVLGALAILVHAVRLNTLEFSNHKGVTWSGRAFSPFKKSK